MKKQRWGFLPMATAGFALLLSCLFLLRGMTRPAVLTDFTPQQTETDPSPNLNEPAFPINVNSASAEELAYLTGIGSSIAERIVDYRTENGPFEQISDLMNVSGIGPERLEQILPYITTGG